MRIMTSNIWGDFFGNEVTSREGQLYQVYKNYAPDVIGIQEATASWYKSEMFQKLEKDGYLFLGAHFIHPELYEAVPGWPLYGEAVYLPLLVKTEVFAVLEYGWELFKNTPDHSKAVTWAVLQRKEDKKTFGICNTHFWWMERGKEDEDVRNQNAQQMSAVMAHLREKHQCPVFAMGDMNTRVGSGVFTVFRENGVKDLWEEAEEASKSSSWHGDPKRGEDGKYHGEPSSEDEKGSLDHIVGLGEEYQVKRYQVVEDQDVLDATDHCPVYADIELL